MPLPSFNQSRKEKASVVARKKHQVLSQQTGLALSLRFPTCTMGIINSLSLSGGTSNIKACEMLSKVPDVQQMQAGVIFIILIHHLNIWLISK